MARPFRSSRPIAWRLVVVVLSALFARTDASFAVVDCHDNAVIGNIVGAGVAGNRDGRFEKSLLNSPSSVSCNSTLCYLSDSGNHAIKTLTLSKNEMVHLAGSSEGSSGLRDGQASEAACGSSSNPTEPLFSSPQGVVLVSQTSAYFSRGDVLVADAGNNAIRKVSGKTVSTVISGLSTPPMALVLDESDGAIYFLSNSTHHLSKLSYNAVSATSVAGSQTTAGMVDSATASSARFSAPEGLTLDAANRTLYIADTGNHAIRKFVLSTGAVTTVLGDGTISSSATVLDSDGELATPARFNYPAGIAYNYDTGLSSGVLIVSDRGTHRLRKIVLSDSTASNAATVVSVGGSYNGKSGFLDSTYGSSALLNTPVSISYVTDSSYVVADKSNHAMRKVHIESPVDVTFTIQSVADVERTVESHDLVLLNYGRYSINGPPYNETTHFSGELTYFGEEHEITMCAHPSVDYFVKFEGSMQAMVKDSTNHLYFGYTGSSVTDSMARTFRIRGPGCMDKSAPNYNPFATSDDGSCVSGVKVHFNVSVWGVVEHAVYEFEGPGFYVSDSFPTGSGEAEYTQDVYHEFTAYPGGTYIAHFYGALNASLTTVSGQSGLGATEISYWSYSSSEASDQGSKSARITGPGCIDASYPTYNQYASESDEVNACSFGANMRVIINASSASESWYDYGSITAPGINEASQKVDGISLDNATDQVVVDVTLVPGVYEFDSFGDVSVDVQQLQSSGFVSLNTWVGTDSSLRYDQHGFATAQQERVVVSFPPSSSRYITTNVVGYAGGILLGDDDVSSVTFEEGSVPKLGSITSTFLKSTLTTSALNSLWYTNNINAYGVTPYTMVLTPDAYQFGVSVKLLLKYDESSSTSQEGNDNLVLFKQGVKVKSVYGAAFDSTAGTVTAKLDSPGTFGVAFRATIRGISPPRVYIDGGTNVTVDGVDMSSLATLGTQTSNQKCRWGDKFTAATTVASADARSVLSGSDSTVKGTKINAVSCLSPSMKYAGFTIVEFYNSGNLMTSNTNLTLLLTASPYITSVVPAEGTISGGTIVTVSGNFLRAGASSSDWEKYDADSTFFANSGPTALSCVFGSVTSSGVAISSAVAMCESPSSSSAVSTSLRAGDPTYPVIGYGDYSFVDDFDTSITPTAYKDNSGISVMTDGGVEISLFGATGSLTKQRNEFYDWQCLFGTVRVAAREKPYGDLSCLSTSLARGSTLDVRLVGPNGEGSLLLGSVSSDTIADTYVDSIVTLPGTPETIQTLAVIGREQSPQFWEPLKWISTAHALISPPGSGWVGTGQGFGHGAYGDPNCTFTSDAGVITTRVATIISSALVVCEAPISESKVWSSVHVAANSLYSGAPRTLIPLWFTPQTRTAATSLTRLVTTWFPSASAGGVRAVAQGYISNVQPIPTLCYYGLSIDPTSFTTSDGCEIPRVLSPGFVTISLNSTSAVPAFEHQLEILEPVRSKTVYPRFLTVDGGSIVDISGTDMYISPNGPPLHCGFTYSTKMFKATYVSSALVKCETLASYLDGDKNEFNLFIGRDEDLTGSEPIELSASPTNKTIAAVANTFGVRAKAAPTVTAVSPTAGNARGGAVFAINGTSFTYESGSARCIFGNVYVSATVYNSTHADCVVPSLYPLRVYSVAFSLVGSAAQRLLDSSFTYANGTACSYAVF